MRNYEVTFIVDPVLSGDEIKSTAQTYSDLIKNEDCKIVHSDHMGLRQLAYPINKRSSGIYYSYEFQTPNGDVIPKLELAFRRDERIMRFLTCKLDKYGVKYNDDKRKGLIGKKKSKSDDSKKEEIPAVKDDLTKIEGIGPKISEALAKGVITSYVGLASKTVAEIKAVLDEAEGNFGAHDPSTWGRQARLAADGKWDELKILQDELDGGKPAAGTSEEE